MYFMNEISELSNKELGEILYDFTKCGRCSECKADGVLCGFNDPVKVRMNFAKEVAKRLIKEG